MLKRQELYQLKHGPQSLLTMGNEIPVSCARARPADKLGRLSAMARQLTKVPPRVEIAIRKLQLSALSWKLRSIKRLLENMRGSMEQAHDV